MRLKATPEDFRVEEVLAPLGGPGDHLLLRVEKRGLTTFDAARLLARAAGVSLDRIAYAGLKDRHAVALQHFSLAGGARPRGPVRGLTVTEAGTIARPLRGSDIAANRFRLVVRDLSRRRARGARGAAVELARIGLPNYFDEQRFGSLQRGLGWPGLLFIEGRFEEALNVLYAAPSPRDTPRERRRKRSIRRAWGRFGQVARLLRGAPGRSVFAYLARRPRDFAGAVRKIPARERLVHLYAYQSYIWNESVARFLRSLLPESSLLERPSIHGPLAFWRRDPGALRRAEVPLIDHRTRITEPALAEAVRGVLADEDLTIEDFRVRGVRGLFLREEMRPLALPLRSLSASAPRRDERHPGRHRVTLEMELGRGAYATLVAKRLFG